MSLKTSHGHRQRLRERFMKCGFAGFADHEVVELILTLCIPRSDVKPQAKALLKKFGSLRAIFDADSEALQSIPGIGSVAPVALSIIRESANLYLQASAQDLPILNNSEKLELFWRSRLGGLKHEVFEVAFLDHRFRLLADGVERLEEGIFNQAMIYPRKVMQAAMKHSAAAIVIAHNHPTGFAYPSPEDQELTYALIQAASNLEIQILDHLIITADDVFSFRQNSLLDLGMPPPPIPQYAEHGSL